MLVDDIVAAEFHTFHTFTGNCQQIRGVHDKIISLLLCKSSLPWMKIAWILAFLKANLGQCMREVLHWKCPLDFELLNNKSLGFVVNHCFQMFLPPFQSIETAWLSMPSTLAI